MAKTKPKIQDLKEVLQMWVDQYFLEMQNNKTREDTRSKCEKTEFERYMGIGNANVQEWYTKGKLDGCCLALGWSWKVDYEKESIEFFTQNLSTERKKRLFVLKRNQDTD